MAMMANVGVSPEHLRAVFKRGVDNRNWLIDNYVKLAEKYLNKFVAVDGGKVIAVADSVDELIDILKEKGADLSTVAIDYITLEKLILIL